MICPKCNTRNPDKSSKCSNCGSVLSSSDSLDSLSAMKTTFSSESLESSLKKGAIFAGRYEILEEGLKGGMGMVSKVKDNTLGKVRALKIILPAYLENEKVISRFRQEVSITQELLHENIVRVYDIGESEGMIYFTMEWIDGISMRDYINERKKQNNKLSLEEAIHLIKQICSALSYAHKTIIHRDIKPENILIINPYSGDPKIKITDFGIAKMESQALHVSASSYMGTPIYMAPEQYTDASHADKRADIYSVGVILYELLTFLHPLGTFPMPSEVNPSIPQKVDEIIKKALNSDRTKRYEDAMDIVKALEAPLVEAPAVKEKPVEQKEIRIQKVKVEQPHYTLPPSQITPEKKKSMFVPAIAVLLLLIGIIGYKSLFSKRETSIIITQTPLQEKVSEGVPKSETDMKSLKESDLTGQRIQAQTSKAILEVGIFYEDNGKLRPLKDGMTLHSKDSYVIYFKPKENSYVYIFQVDSNGQAFKLFPNPEEYKTISNPLRANRAYWIPAEGKFFFLDEAVGKEEIFFFASKRPIKSLEEIKTTSKMVMAETTKLMGVGGTTESKMTVEVVTKGETLPFDMAKTRINSTGDLVYNTWFWHK